jgi:hypothetical protein
MPLQRHAHSPYGGIHQGCPYNAMHKPVWRHPPGMPLQRHAHGPYGIHQGCPYNAMRIVRRHPLGMPLQRHAHGPYGIHQGCPYNAMRIVRRHPLGMPLQRHALPAFRYFGVSLSITLSGFPLFLLFSLFSLFSLSTFLASHTPTLWSVVEHNAFQFYTHSGLPVLILSLLLICRSAGA